MNLLVGFCFNDVAGLNDLLDIVLINNLTNQHEFFHKRFANLP